MIISIASWIVLLLVSSLSVFASPSNDTTTIIDILSSTPEYSILLKYLQRTGLIPLINQSRGATLIAPINSAFYRLQGYSSHNEDLAAISRDLLLYHLVNSTIVSEDVASDTIVQSYLESEHIQPSSSRGMPVFISPVKSGNTTTGLIVNGMAKVVELDQLAGYERGAVQGVDIVLQRPRSLCETVGALPDTSVMSSFLAMEYECGSEMVESMITLLLPADEAFHSQFKVVEVIYLLSTYGDIDRKAIIDRHIIPQLVLPQELNENNGKTIKTLDGTVLNIDEEYIINSTFEPTAVNILASNGLIHMYNKVISVDSPLVSFTPEKYLYGMKADDFVKEAHIRQLSYLINGSTDTPQTVFVPVDSSGRGDPPNVLYHFVEGQYSLDDFQHLALSSSDDFLLETKLSTHRLGGFHQRIKGHVSFKKNVVAVGSQEIVSQEQIIGNTSIYLVDGSGFDLPSSLTTALGPFFQSSYSLGFLHTLHLLQPPKGNPRTYLVPSRQAWENQSLVKTYLETNTTALQKVFESLIFETPFYTNDEPRIVTSLDGNEVELSMDKSGSIKMDDICYDLDAADILFDTGVAHSIDEFYLPHTIEVSPKDIICANGRSEFVDLLNSRNMSHILDRGSYTILVPNGDALVKDGYNADNHDVDLLLSLHILPGNPIAKLFSGDAVDTSADNVKLKGRNVTKNFHFVEIVDGESHEAYVVGRGDACVVKGSFTTVLFLDRYISPGWIKKPIIRPPFHLKTHVAILIGVALGIISVFAVMVLAFYSFAADTKNSERRPLLAASRNNSSSSEEYSEEHQETYGAVPTTTSPIPTSHVHGQREFGRHLNLPAP
jgi:uncharacterized surface protein with fasciclin (FAS1) repeats